MTRPSHTARILELLRAGRSPAVIAAELGVTPGRVRQVAQAHAIPLPRSPRPGRDTAASALRSGSSVWKAAREAGVSLAVARQIATEIGARSPAGRKPTVARVITLRLTAAESARLTEVAGGYSQVTAWAREALRRAAGVG